MPIRGERETSGETLMARHGIGRRLATRIVALLSRRLAFTETVIATAAEDEALERLLLSAALLGGAAELDEPTLREAAAGAGVAEAELLRLVDGEQAGWRIVALEDDLLAATAQQDQAAGGGEEIQLVRRTPSDISARETTDLFTPEEIARLKLTALTSQNPDERVEAVRKLVFVPMDGAQRAGIFLNIVVERDAPVRLRREAIRALEQIGFRSDMADAVRGLFAEDGEEVVYAVQRLGALLREAEAGETALLLSVILEVFDETRETDVVRELLGLIGRSAPLLVSNPEKADHFLQSALGHAARVLPEIRLAAERAVRACLETAPALVADVLWRELDRSDSPAVRAFVLGLCQAAGAREAAPDRADELAPRAVAELLNPDLPEADRARLRYVLLRMGEPAAREALARIGAASHADQGELVRLLDVVCTEGDVPDEVVQDAARAVLSVLRLADTASRRGILQTSILSDQRVDPALRGEIAAELIALADEIGLPNTLDLIENLLERVGNPALEPAYACLVRAYPSAGAARAARAAARIIEDQAGGVPGDLAGRILTTCLELLEDPDLEEGAFTLMLAAACGYTPAGRPQFAQLLTRLREGLWQRPYTTDALDALAIMAGSPNASHAEQTDLLAFFGAIARYETTAGLGARKETEEGVVFEFSRGVEFDIRVIPSAVRGLRRICLSEQATAEMRTEIVKLLLTLWEGVSNVRVVWGPAAIESLIDAMCTAACMPTAGLAARQRLGTSLLRSLNKISVVRSIGTIFSGPCEQPAMQELCLAGGRRLLAEWEEAERQDDERRLALLQSAGRIAANPSLDADDVEVSRLRDRTVQALFRGLRDGLHGVRDALIAMRDCGGVSERVQQDIDSRLGKVFGLQRSGDD